jgi:ABC-2 type transport system permease protein
VIGALVRILPPGSAAWLLAAEVRLGLRGMTGKRGGASGSRVALIIISIVAVAGVLFGGLALGFLASRWPLPVTPLSALIVDAACVVLFTLMLSQAINLAVQALYERGDLDLLLSSPLRPRVVLTVRALSITVVASILYVALVTPFVITASVLGRPEWLSLFVILISLAMVATALGILLTMGLFALIGPRKTRVVAQVLAALVGGLMFVLSQLYNFTRHEGGGSSGVADFALGLTASPLLAPDAPLAWPVRAVTASPLPLIVIGGVGVVLLGAVIRLLGPRFARDAAAAVGEKSTPARTRGADGAFANGLTPVLIRKELRLLARDPQLISQILLRIVYLIPLGIVLFKSSHSETGPTFGGAAIVFMAGQLAGSFAWIAISAEDSPDLLRSAPIDRALADRAKLIAALIPTFVLTGLAVGGFAVLAPVKAAVVLIGCICAAACSGLIQIWRQKPATRKAFNQRQRGGSWLVNIAEMFVQAGWGGATALALVGMVWAIIPAVVATLITLALYRSPQKRWEH